MKPYLWHLFFDLLAFILSLVFIKVELSRDSRIQTDTNYWKALCVGTILGAYFFGSFNLSINTLDFRLGHSIAGALLGAIVFVEIYKWIKGIRYSTGSSFVIPITVGIIVGRWGCFLAGLTDQTYGISSRLPWAVDFGDGIHRHPVQIYESLSMTLFLVFIIFWRKKFPELYQIRAFYFFTFFYAFQRFFWEFLKPYPTLWLNLNTFHFVCLGLMIYSLFMLRLNHAAKHSSSED